MLSKSMSGMYLNVTDEQKAKAALQREFFAICKATQLQKNREDHNLSDHEMVLIQVKHFMDAHPNFYPGVDYVGFTPAHYLAGRGNVMTMTYLSERFPDYDWDVSHDQGWSPIVNACYFGQLESLKFLISKGVDLHPSLSGKTLAHIAAFRQNPQTSVDEFSAARKPIFDLLIEHGINLEQQDARGQTPVDVMAYNLFEVPQTLDPFGRTYVHWAAYMPKLRDVPELNVLIHDPEVIRQPDEYGKTALMYAASMGDAGFFDRLLPLSDVSAQGIGGTTALHYAASKPTNTQVVQNLLRLGLEPLQRDKSGQSAFDVAFMCGCDEILEILQAHVLETKLMNCMDGSSESLLGTHLSDSHSGQMSSPRLTTSFDSELDASRSALPASNNQSSPRESPKPY